MLKPVFRTTGEFKACEFRVVHSKQPWCVACGLSPLLLSTDADREKLLYHDEEYAESYLMIAEEPSKPVLGVLSTCGTTAGYDLLRLRVLASMAGENCSHMEAKPIKISALPSPVQFQLSTRKFQVSGTRA